MKKFFISFFILLVLGGVCFFFGWVQFQVPPGQYGVIYSKTHGVSQKPVHSGEFRWVWFRLIPTNVKIAVFDLEYKKFPLFFYSILPSGKAYASFTGLTNTDFSWNLHGETAFKIKPEALAQLSVLHNLKEQEDLNQYMKRTAREIEQKILSALSVISSLEDSTRIEKIMSGITDVQMEQEIMDSFPEIDDFSFTIQSAVIPDFALYNQLRLIYQEFLDKQREYITFEFAKRAEKQIESQLKINELEKYGELLTKYPILLDYMQLGIKNEN